MSCLKFLSFCGHNFLKFQTKLKMKLQYLEPWTYGILIIAISGLSLFSLRYLAFKINNTFTQIYNLSETNIVVDRVQLKQIWFVSSFRNRTREHTIITFLIFLCATLFKRPLGFDWSSKNVAVTLFGSDGDIADVILNVMCSDSKCVSLNHVRNFQVKQFVAILFYLTLFGMIILYLYKT